MFQIHKLLLPVDHWSVSNLDWGSFIEPDSWKFNFANSLVIYQELRTVSFLVLDLPMESEKAASLKWNYEFHDSIGVTLAEII